MQPQLTEATEALARKQVNMKVRNLVPGIRPAVDDQPVARLRNSNVVGGFVCNLRQAGHETQPIAGKVTDLRHVFLRDDEQVGRGLGADVPQNEDIFRIENHLARQLSVADTAEDTIFPGHPTVQFFLSEYVATVDSARSSLMSFSRWVRTFPAAGARKSFFRFFG